MLASTCSSQAEKTAMIAEAPQVAREPEGRAAPTPPYSGVQPATPHAAATSAPPASTSSGAGTARSGTCAAAREVKGTFGRGVDFISTPMDKSARIVMSSVKDRMKRKGHGVKHGVSGSLERGSPWFYPDDPLASEIPDRDVHLMRPIFLCVWEFLDPDIKAPSCPKCKNSDHVR